MVFSTIDVSQTSQAFVDILNIACGDLQTHCGHIEAVHVGFN